jgi:hypothetical protein
VAESSGLADSWLREDILWTHNDSSYDPEFFLIRKEDAEVVTRVRLLGAQNIDWEDMAIGPCEPSSDTPCVYIGDIGDNLARYPTRTIYRFPEPVLTEPFPEQLDIAVFDRLDYVYPDGPRDAETLLVHPVTAQIYVIEKAETGQSHVFRIPTSFGHQAPVEAEHIGTLQIDGPMSFARMVTGGDFSPDGRQFTLRTYTSLYVYCADPEAGAGEYETAFAGSAEPTPQSPLTIQGEALTYDRSDGALWLTSERIPTPLIRVPPRTAVDEDEAPVGVEPHTDADSEDSDDRDTGSSDGPEAPSAQPTPVDSATPEPSSCACATSNSSRRTTVFPVMLLALFGLRSAWRRS